VGLPVLLALVLVSGVLCSRWFEHTPSFRDAAGKVVPGSIAVFEQVELGGYRQTLLIRGRSAVNPVLLYLHGGPGSTELPLVRHFNAPLEDHFTVVLWEQRGAGKSYSPFLDRSTLNIEQLLGDAHELVLYLRQRFHQEKIFLVGHSWGSFLGLELARRYPALIRAYVGIGQVVSLWEGERLSMQFALHQAEAAGNAQAAAELRGIGEYPTLREGWLKGVFTERAWLGHFGGVVYGRDGMGSLFAVERPPEFTLFDFVPFFLGSYTSLEALWPQLLRAGDFRDTAPKLLVPVYLCLGRHDYNVPFALAEDYFQRLQAPRKQLFWFESSAHMPNFEEPEKFNGLLIDRVLPESVSPGGQ
jgi:pimeloyl-ACP methyl ester carboxylesterase